MSIVKIAIGFMLMIFNKPLVNIIEWGEKSRLPWQKKKSRKEKAEAPR
jgi:hypothetical protein